MADFHGKDISQACHILMYGNHGIDKYRYSRHCQLQCSTLSISGSYQLARVDGGSRLEHSWNAWEFRGRYYV